MAIGSNLDNPIAQVSAGFVALEQLPNTRVIARSQLYCSPPLGPQEQPEYVNAVAGLLTQLTPQNLLTELQRLEMHLGRTQPVQRWGPRVIDFDLVVYGNQQISSDTLTVPHAEIAKRNFVLVPLAEIAPTLDVPGHGRVEVLAARVGSAGLRLL
ncbi:MAG: 2-amino-4-hydroxy-6-hydroxymethyldihydropteridine diphosphokinase [Candidatus Obscuribacterales bacterium]|nr:2-amino-4-hydroxy-6-hydroxymethyldihydropteridine diphosphokinase [Steroidobacteraceae bacterium]